MIRTNTRVALYARFSSDNQRTESIDAQYGPCKHTAHSTIMSSSIRT